MRPGPGLVWFRRDLRITDNPAWAAATCEHRAVVALFVLDQRVLRHAGRLRRDQLVAELHALHAGLADRGGGLLVRHGLPEQVVPAVAAEHHVGAVYWNTDVSPFAVARDAHVTAQLGHTGVPVEPAQGLYVVAPGAIRTAAGHVPRVFGAFHRRWRATEWEPWPDAGDASVIAPDRTELPAADLPAPHPPGEAAAAAQLAAFTAGPVDAYRAGHDDVAVERTSALSVALHFGTLSPRRVVAAAGAANDDRSAFVRQLAWRDWFAHLLAENPQLVRAALRPRYDGVAWRDDPAGVAAWQEGRTGYPIVDAGMRQLAATGAMHNRVRMIAASFLVKDLLVDWRVGERYFRAALLDGDVAQNVGNWQWVAGTGPDAAPYFRIFNPITQSRRFDPDGGYLRRWVPELATLTNRDVHEPWAAPVERLADADVELGVTYPRPIVDHATARQRALAAYATARGAT